MNRGTSDLPRASFLLGVYAVTAQVVVIRECFVSYYGSEITLGIVLAFWMLWVGAGSLAGSRVFERRFSPSHLQAWLAGVQVAAACALPAAVLLARTMPLWSTVPEGEFPSLAVTAVTAAFFTAGPGFMSGAWFAAASLLPAPGLTGAGRAYSWEALGALAGGLGFTFLAAGRLDGMESAVILAAITVGGGLVLRRSSGQRPLLYSAAAALVIAAVSAVLLTPRQGTSLAASTENLRWPGLKLIATAESPFGHLALTELQGQNTLYANGVPALSFPGRTTEGAALHLALLAAGKTESVLLVGKGLGGALGEILLHPVKKLHYVEADAATLPLVTPHLPPSLAETLADPRLSVIHDDARHWLQSTPGTYDVIILDVPEPSTALFNRLYTVEFFRLVRESLHSRGVFSMAVTASHHYRGEGRLRRNRSVYQALRAVFGDVTVLSGEGAVLLASADTAPPGIPDLAEAAAARAPESPTARPALLQVLLDPARARDLSQNLRGPEKVNSDIRPVGYFYHAIHWGGLSAPRLAGLLEMLTGPLRFLPAALPLILLAAAIVLATGTQDVRRRLAPSVAAFSTGWVSMSLYGLILFSYQTSQGHLYQRIGILTAFFMAGTAAGGFAALARLRRGSPPFPLLRRAESVLFLGCPLIGIVVLAAVGSVMPERAADLLFASLAAVTGFLTGFEFPLFGPAERKGSPSSGGKFYFLDLAGAAAGILLVFLWILPLLGLKAGFLFAAALKAASLTATLEFQG